MAAGSLRYNPDPEVDGAVLLLSPGDTEPQSEPVVFAGPDREGRATSIGGVITVRRQPQGDDNGHAYVRLQATERRAGRVRVYGDPVVAPQTNHAWTAELAQDPGTNLNRRRSGHVVLRGFDDAGQPHRTARLGGRELPDETAADVQAAEAAAGRRGDLKLYEAGSLRAQLWIDDASNGRLTLRNAQRRITTSLGFQRQYGGNALYLDGDRGTAVIGVSEYEGAFLSLITHDGGEIRIDPSGIAIANVLKERFLNSFVAAHPEDPALEIRYTVLEGPEPGTYVRGTAALVMGRATVALPGHFRHVTASEGLTVQLTPRSPRSKGVCASRVTTTEVVIEELHDGRGEYEVDYQVHGIRRGFEKYEAVRPAPATTSRARARQEEEG